MNRPVQLAYLRVVYREHVRPRLHRFRNASLDWSVYGTTGFPERPTLLLTQQWPAAFFRRALPH